MYLRALLIAYIVMMPMLHGLSPVPVVSFNVLFLFMAIPAIFLAERRQGFDFAIQSALIIGVYLYGLLAWFWYPAGVYQDRLQGALQWAFSLFGLWWIARRWIANSRISFYNVSAACFYGAIFLSVATVFEFVLSNTTGRFFSDYIPFSIDEFPVATVFGTAFQRPRVFSAEAGFTSMAYELFLPISVFYFLRLPLPAKGAYLAVVSIGFLLLFSTASIISLIFAGVLLAAVSRQSQSSKYVIPVFATALFAVVIMNAESTDLPFYKILEFFDASNYTLSQGSRQEAINAAVTLVTEHPLGVGWGTVLQESKISGSEIDRMILGTGLISLWLDIAVSLGLAGLLVLLYQLSSTLYKLAQLHRLEASLCFISLTSLALHHVAVLELWFPMFWFAFALAQVVLVEGQRLQAEAT